MNKRPKKITGVFRVTVITVLMILLASLFFNAMSIIAAAVFARLGITAVYIGVAVNVAGAALATWAGARLAMAGRMLKTGRSLKTALLAAILFALIDIACGLTGDFLSVMAGRAGFYVSTLIQGAGSFIVVFLVAREVFRKREVDVV